MKKPFSPVDLIKMPIDEFVKYMNSFTLDEVNKSLDHAFFFNPSFAASDIQIVDKNTYGIKLLDKTINVSMWISYEDLNSLFSGSLCIKETIDPNVKIFPRIGFYTPNYAEFGLAWRTDFDKETYGSYKVPKIILEFSLGEIIVQIGDISPLWEQLIGGEGMINGYWMPINLLPKSIKFQGALPDDIERVISQALFHINSKLPIQSSYASLHRIPHYEDDNIKNLSTVPDINGIDINLTSEIGPYSLFLSAREFLGYYKIMEYFFFRSHENALDGIRWDRNLSGKEFINKVESFYRWNEQKSLELVIENIADETIYKLVQSSGLVEQIDLNAKTLAKKIYKRRNDLVHTKEEKKPLIQSVLPTPDEEAVVWEDIMRNLAINAIDTYCK